MAILPRSRLLTLLQLTRNIDSRHGYRRLEWSGGRISDEDGEHVTAEFWRKSHNDVVLRFTAYNSGERYTYCYKCNVSSETSFSDEFMRSEAIQSDVESMLENWLAEGTDYDPAYYFETEIDPDSSNSTATS